MRIVVRQEIWFTSCLLTIGEQRDIIHYFCVLERSLTEERSIKVVSRKI